MGWIGTQFLSDSDGIEVSKSVHLRLTSSSTALRIGVRWMGKEACV